MNISKKFDRAFQWAGEKMGTESKTTMSEEFKMLEAEMALRLDGANPSSTPATALIRS
jgi:BAR domain.